MKYLDNKSLISSNDFFNLWCVFLSKKNKMLFSSRSESFKKKKDMNIIEARKILGKKIIGITCHNSIKLSKKAIKDGADYIALGAFYPTNTKNIKFKAKVSDLIRIKKLSTLPIIAIGGINKDNYKNLLLNKANFLAISSYVFNNKKFKPIDAIKMLK